MPPTFVRKVDCFDFFTIRTPRLASGLYLLFAANGSADGFTLNLPALHKGVT